MKNKNTYKYVKKDSILGNNNDSYHLTAEEYYLLYSFYVTYSLCNNLSAKKKNFVDYGWESNKIQNTDLGKTLNTVLKLNRNSNFIFAKDNFEQHFISQKLFDGELMDITTERAVIMKSPDSNNYLHLFHRVRNGLAHGKFRLCVSNNNEKMVIIQDNDSYNVTARIVIKLSTLINFIYAVDRNNILVSNFR